MENLIGGKIDYSALSRGALRRHADFFSDAKMAGGVAQIYRDVLAN